MPVIADSDEPPAKCCKVCDETKCNVDGGAISWRLTLDQDLLDTLKESFPDWFQQTDQIKSPNTESDVNNNNTTITKLNNNTYKFGNNNLDQADTNTDNVNNYVNSSITILNCVTCEIINKNINCSTKRSKKQQYKESDINNESARQQHLKQSNGNKATLALTSKTLSSTSSVNSRSTLNAKNFIVTTTKKQTNNNKRYCNVVSAPTAISETEVNNLHTFLSSNCSASSKALSPFLTSPTSCTSSSLAFSLSQSPILNIKRFHNDSSLILLSESVATIPTKKSTVVIATTTTAPATAGAASAASGTTTTTTTAAIAIETITVPTVINSHSTIFSQTSFTTAPTFTFSNVTDENCCTTTTTTITTTITNPLLATFSDSVALKILSDSCSHNRLLTTSTPLTSSTSSTATSGSHSFVHNLIIKTPVEYTYEDNILLKESHKDNMSEEGQQHLSAASSLTGKDGTSSVVYDSRQSSPKAFVDSSPLQPAMDKNKESLKVKLMVRRPHSQLVEQGIIPPLKTSPAIHEQCKQLERAKTSDLLKAKIQQRPNREDLERRHILEEDECHIDPSLAEKQRMLKKARLADQLNSQIQHRPGPLELIKKNILHTEKPIEKIVKEGLVTFKATSEGLLTRPQHPHSYVTFEDESLSSESDSLRQTPSRDNGNEFVSAITDTVVCANSKVLQGRTATIEVAAMPEPVSTACDSAFLKTTTVEASTRLEESKCNYGTHQITSSSLPTFKVTQETANLYEELCQSVTGSGNKYLSMISSVPSTSFDSSVSSFSPVSSTISSSRNLTTSAVSSSGIQIAKSDAPGKDKNRKKSKSKPSSKARTIKFHEYKGPPSASNKNSMDTSMTTEETSYQLMLEQQNCLLKFLETLNKNQSILPAGNTGPNTHVPSATAISTGGKSGTNVTNTVITATANFNNTLSQAAPISTTCTPMQGIASESLLHSNNHAPIGLSNLTNNSCSSRPSITTSPALSITSMPLSPATNYATSIIDVTKLEKMKVSDLKVHLKRRNLPVSGSKSQLIERLRSYLTLEPSSNTSSNTVINPTQTGLNKEAERDMNVEAMDTNTGTATGLRCGTMEQEQINGSAMQSPQSETANSIILSNEELLKEQQRKIDELQRQLQKSQQELQEIRQKQHQHMINQKFRQQTLPNGLSAQQITLIATTKPAQASHTVAVLHPQINETFVPARITLKAASTVKTVVMPSSVNDKKDKTTTSMEGPIVKQSNSTTMMSQKMVVKQQLEAKIQKQAAAAAAKAQAQAQMTQSQQKHAYHLHQEAQTPKNQTNSIPMPTSVALTASINKANEKVITTKGLPHNVIVKTSQPSNFDVATDLAVNQSRLPLTRANNNLGLVWNESNQTIFLVGLNDQHMTSHTIGNINLATSSDGNKRFFNSHRCTNSVANVTFSVPSESTYNQFNTQQIITQPTQEPTTIIQTKQFPLSQQMQKSQQKHLKKVQTKFDQQRHLIDQQQYLHIAATSPSIKYKEDIKHLQDNINNNEQKMSSILNPLIKIKEESTINMQSEQDGQQRQEYQPNAINGQIIKSEKLTDVLGILVKQGDLPESALVPIAPVNKLFIPTENKEFINDLDNDIQEDKAAGEQHQLTSKTYINKIDRMKMDSNNPITRKISPTQTQSQSQLQNEFNSFYKSLNTPPAITITNSNNFNPNFMQNIHITPTKSFGQSNLITNTTNASKSFDMFLDEEQQILHGDNADQCNNNSLSCRNDDVNLMNKEVKEVDVNCGGSIATAAQNFPAISHSDYQQHNNQNVIDRVDYLGHLSNIDTKLNHFDEFELLELMSQQLEMDIGEASELTPHTIPVGKHNNINQITSQFHHSNIKLNASNSCTVNTNGFRRSMNPSMQPSLTELMQSQATVANVDNPSSHHQLNNNNNVIEKFHTESLNQFDNVTLIQPNEISQQQSTLPSQGSQQEEQQSNPNNLINDNQFLSIQMNPTNSIMPMDVCDDFDNTLNDFNFSSSTSNIDTLRPSTPTFDQFDLSSTSENVVSSSTTNATPSTNYGITFQDSNSSTTTAKHCIHPNHEEMSICSTSLSDNGIISHNDATFCSASSDIFDLFNMDDYKMAWSEGDFVV